MEKTMDLKIILELSLGQKLGQLRAVPVSVNCGNSKAILATYCADFDVDPYVEMFFFPTDTYKMALFDEKGGILWKKDLGPAVVPGIWFCPVFPFDLDGDGIDEIWYVNNVNEKHALGLSGYRLERIDALTGKTTGQWEWPTTGGDQTLSHLFRNFITGGYVQGEPVLVTAQGTYGKMLLQGWNGGMRKRWDTRVAQDSPGARGSHMCPVVDINQDGVDELMWGERCIELASGKELFCADRDTYSGHSDVIQPVWNSLENRWLFYTCREGHPKASPRVAAFDDKGQRLWGDVDQGHMDMGWVARLGENGEKVAMAVRIGSKTCGPDGRFHQNMDEFTYDVFSGKPYKLPYSIYRTLPVDINGDGYHELVRGVPGGNGEVLDRTGRVLGNIGGTVSMASKFMDLPGEQVLAFYPEGTVRIWGDRNAADSPEALLRYKHPFYSLNQRVTSVGYNLVNLGGL